MSRPSRQYALLLGLVLVVVLAGCTGGGGTPTATAADGASDGAGDGSDGDSDGSDGGDGDGDTAATPAPTATLSPTASPTPTPNASGPATTEPLPRMSDLLDLEDSYRFTAEFQTEDGTLRQEGRWYQTDFVVDLTIPQQEGTLTIYNVDGDEAYLADGECLSQRVPETKDPGNWTEAGYLQNVTVRPSRTTTIDGETVYVYETESGQPNLDGPFTYYVSAETGHLLKQESSDATIEMYDWGHDESVELPC